MYLCRILLALVFSGIVCFNVSTLSAQPVISYGTAVVSGLNNPVDIVNAGDSRLFIAQQNGLILSWNGTTLSTFMDLSGVPNLFPSPSVESRGC